MYAKRSQFIPLNTHTHLKSPLAGLYDQVDLTLLDASLIVDEIFTVLKDRRLFLNSETTIVFHWESRLQVPRPLYTENTHVTPLKVNSVIRVDCQWVNCVSLQIVNSFHINEQLFLTKNQTNKMYQPFSSSSIKNIVYYSFEIFRSFVILGHFNATTCILQGNKAGHPHMQIIIMIRSKFQRSPALPGDFTIL